MKKPIGILVWVSVLLLVVFGGYSIYPYFVMACCARDSTPKEWNQELLLMTHQEIVTRLGRPDTDMSAKDFQAWEKETWWGRQVLQIGFVDCCKDSSTPVDIHVIKYAQFRYKPIEVKKISRDGS